MTKPIKLTSALGNGDVYLNPNHYCSFYAVHDPNTGKCSTEILLPHGAVRVNETPGELVACLDGGKWAVR